ncbi:EAL domain-containing protein [Pseudoalteromonas shioyasakiensis]|uniref:EAL domain-containing protein n=1 Tax=Pseudoalteromonas shioyasakiensis TaxID=1190813 RepID=UPI002117F2ED|nr:EAL domain-containing protein [Pseudoalteromonas shioyasakiensis]MCQ8879490.1 EAL domain-containing protein [Pseudoalteromonas shioyasakiensis]
MVVDKSLSNVFTQTLEQAIDGVVAIDSKNRVILFNQAAEKLWGYCKEEVLGKNVSLLVPDHIKTYHDHYVNRNRDTGENKIVGTSRDVPIICKDGSQRWGSMSISKVDIGGHMLYTAFIKDVTEQVKAKKQLELLSLVTDKTEHAIIITDPQWKVVYTNDGFSTLFNYTPEELLGITPMNVLTPELSDTRREQVRAQLANGKSMRIDEVLQSKDKSKCWCSIMVNPVLDEHTQLAYCVTIINDITQTKLHEILHKQILNAIAYDESHEIVMEKVCHEITKLDHYITPVILKAEGAHLQLLAAPSFPASYRQILNTLPIAEGAGISGTAAARGEDVLVTDIQNDPICELYKTHLHPLGYTGCFSVPIKQSNGQVIGVVTLYLKNNVQLNALHKHIVNVITPLCGLAIEREAQKANIRHLAYYDALTQLPNRSLLHANAEQAIKDAKKNNQKMALLFLDVDRFKQINDTHGHPIGDQLLVALASRLNLEQSNADIVGRLSGDEFVLIKQIETPEQLHEYIEELKLKITLPVHLEHLTLDPTMSIGISIFPDDGHDVATLIHRADMAMYQAKSSGKGRFAYFSHELNQLAQEVQELEMELEKAIKENLLTLKYQPQISMKDETIYGVEALARWDHPTLGSVPPDKFIPIAEDCGLISELSLWVIRTACKQMGEWRKQGIALPTMSVNLSPSNFHNIHLCDFIINELAINNLVTSDLMLELTEHVLLDTHPSTMKVLHDIHDKGIDFSMDDFGTGYASLSYLRKIPIRELKLDRSFVQGLGTDKTSEALSRSVLQIGESLNLDVIAEGIENVEQYTILKEQGYHVAQGYLFSKPLNANETEKFLKNKHQSN